VEVRRNEGIANHIDPEPCVHTRKGEDEASVGESTGQPLSRETNLSRVPTFLRRRKAICRGTINASAAMTRRGRRTWHMDTLFAREPGDPESGQQDYQLVRTEKARSHTR